MVTMRQLNQRPARRWAAEMGFRLSPSRKTWERVFVVQSLASRGCLAAGRRGLGFGVGADPMIPVMANRGVHLVATDYGESDFKGWGEDLDLDPRRVSTPEVMSRYVKRRSVDMNEIPSELRDFDFLYSCGSLEHIGGLEHGFDFVAAAMDCLRPGGVAVHTTELNISGGSDTLDLPHIGFYLPDDVNQLFERLRSEGHKVSAVDPDLGSTPADCHVARRPYQPPALKVWHSGFQVTSIGFVIERAGGRAMRLRRTKPFLRAVEDVTVDIARGARRRARSFASTSPTT